MKRNGSRWGRICVGSGRLLKVSEGYSFRAFAVIYVDQPVHGMAGRVARADESGGLGARRAHRRAPLRPSRGPSARILDRMPVLIDPITGDRLLVAPARATRPHDLVHPAVPGECPFCDGNEAETPPEVAADRPGGGPADSPGWLTRTVPNRFPAMPPDEGTHEVVLLTPRHDALVGTLTAAEAHRAMAAAASRVRAVVADPRGLLPFLFLNQGAAAGASLRHPHAQVVGLPFDPPRMAAREHAFATAASCPVCDDLAAAHDEGRLVEDGTVLVAWVPRTPAVTAGIRIAPRIHRAAWSAGPDPGALGPVMARLAGLIASRLDHEDLNLWVVEGRSAHGPVHWHADVVPRLGVLAGLEVGAGVLAGANDPSALAARLRAA